MEAYTSQVTPERNFRRQASTVSVIGPGPGGPRYASVINGTIWLTWAVLTMATLTTCSKGGSPA